VFASGATGAPSSAQVAVTVAVNTHPRPPQQTTPDKKGQVNVMTT
jgi:hypothetical protein